MCSFHVWPSWPSNSNKNNTFSTNKISHLAITHTHTHTHTHIYIYIHVYIISYFEYANLRSITTFSIVEYGTYPNVEQLLYFPAISITCPKRVIRCHMPKATNLDHPNWLLPSHLIELKLVAWAHGQTI